MMRSYIYIYFLFLYKFYIFTQNIYSKYLFLATKICYLGKRIYFEIKFIFSMFSQSLAFVRGRYILTDGPVMRSRSDENLAVGLMWRRRKAPCTYHGECERICGNVKTCVEKRVELGMRTRGQGWERVWIEGTPWSREIHQTRPRAPFAGATYGGAARTASTEDWEDVEDVEVAEGLEDQE